MRFSEARRHPVMDTTTAEKLGEVDGFVVDPANHRITALRLARSRAGRLLAWERVAAFGPDAVTVEGGPKRRGGGGRASAPGPELPGRRVLTDRGRDLGPVLDVTFDPATGEVTGVVVAEEALAGERLVGVGSYAVVVTDQTG